MKKLLLSGIACGVSVLCVAAVPSAAPAREWYTLAIDGQRVGYAWHETRSAAGERIDSQVMRVFVSQLQHMSRVETVTDVGRNAAGAPVWIRMQSDGGPDRSGWRATVASDGQTMEVSTAGASRYRVALPTDTTWPDQFPDALRRFATGTVAHLHLRLLDTSSAAIADADLERAGGPDANGVVQVRLTTSVPGNRQRSESFWVGRSGVVRRERTFFAMPLRWDACERNCDVPVERPYDLMARLVVASPYRIPQRALDGPIRYVMTRADGRAPDLPATGEQSVVTDGLKAVVTICASCGAPARLTDAERTTYLGSNPWVRTDAREVRDFARANGGRGQPRKVMSELVDAVRRHMTGGVDYLGYATAIEALQNRSGDCTEFAVLLAAAARARGIPARLASGLVYAGRFSGKKDVFSPHMWVQAWIGDRWVSFDAGLERFDATHIALMVGDGDPRKMDVDAGASGQWRIEQLGLLK